MPNGSGKRGVCVSKKSRQPDPMVARKRVVLVAPIPRAGGNPLYQRAGDFTAAPHGGAGSGRDGKHPCREEKCP